MSEQGWFQGDAQAGAAQPLVHPVAGAFEDRVGRLVDTVEDPNLHVRDPLQGIKGMFTIKHACWCVKGGVNELAAWNVDEALAKAMRHASMLEREGRLAPLTREEAMTVNIYTQDSPFFGVLNTYLRERRTLKPFAPFLHILLSGLYKLPPVSPRTVHRGVTLSTAPIRKRTARSVVAIQQHDM
eukprot:m.160377 g.160377  ORF g.160377 m.160377 type:complete len:184 (+) comp14350_c0_seq1:74-625(+)